DDERGGGQGHHKAYGGMDIRKKHELADGTEETHDIGPGRDASEGVFVPASEGADEDEGWVLTVVYDATRDGSDLALLDATDFTAPPVATVRLPQRVPFGFHGWWLSEGAA